MIVIGVELEGDPRTEVNWENCLLQMRENPVISDWVQI